MCPAGAVWGSGLRTQAGDSHWVHLAWGAATRWPVGFGTRDFPPCGCEKGAKTAADRRGRARGRRAGRPCGGQGRTGDLREVPLPLPGSYKHPPHTHTPKSSAAGAEDLTPPLRFPGVGGFLFGDFVILPPGCSPCGPFGSPLGPRLRHFVFLNRSHLHTTFSFIKNTAEPGEPWVRGLRAPESSRWLACRSRPRGPAARAAVCARACVPGTRAPRGPVARGADPRRAQRGRAGSCGAVQCGPERVCVWGGGGARGSVCAPVHPIACRAPRVQG